jgi:hypothetical protein
VETPGQGGFPKHAAWITITFQLRHAAPKEEDWARTSFKAAVVLTPSDALEIGSALLTVGAAEISRVDSVRARKREPQRRDERGEKSE